MPRGGRRDGAGRPTLFPGKTERKTYSLTPQAVDIIEGLEDELRGEHPDIDISASDAVEYAVHQMALPKRLRSVQTSSKDGRVHRFVARVATEDPKMLARAGRALVREARSIVGRMTADDGRRRNGRNGRG